MANRRRFSFTTFGVLACAVICGGPASERVWGQEVLPTLRKTPRASTVWVGDDGPPAKSAAIPKRTATTPRKTVNAPQMPVAFPQKNIERQIAQPTKTPAVAKVRNEVIAVSDEQPVVKDRRAATLQALADGFRSQRVAAPSDSDVTEAPIKTLAPSMRAAYSTSLSEEPVPQQLPVRENPTPVAMPTRPTSAPAVEANMPAMPIREEPISRHMPAPEFPAQVATPTRPTSSAAVEANMPATLEMLPPASPETSESSTQSRTRFVSDEEPHARPETWQTRMITNPLRRAADSLSQRRNPLRSAD